MPLLRLLCMSLLFAAAFLFFLTTPLLLPLTSPLLSEKLFFLLPQFLLQLLLFQLERSFCLFPPPLFLNVFLHAPLNLSSRFCGFSLLPFLNVLYLLLSPLLFCMELFFLNRLLRTLVRSVLRFLILFLSHLL